jgi:polysaccharide export outer membrane protein
MLLCLPLLAQCVSGPQTNATLDTVMAKEKAAQSHVEEYNQQILAGATRFWQPPDYTINEGDLLLVKVFEAPELTTETRVSDNGDITLPLLGAIGVKGLTSARAEDKIARAYRVNYLENPHINVVVKDQQGGRVTITGAVQKPGSYEYLSQGRLLDVLALAGGLSEKAGQTVQVRRSALESSDDRTMVLIDLDQLVRAGQDDLNIRIRRGDTVFVPQAGVVYVDGAVQSPGNYQIRSAMTVQEAIVAAGGFHSTADPGTIKLARYDDKGGREVILLNGNSSEEGSTSGVTVKDRDIVFVEFNRLASAIYGLRVSLGLVGFGYTPPAR